MRGLHKSKRISWAPDVNLCQVRLFLSEECPSQVGLGGQDHLQAKASWQSHTTGTGSEDILPPGFEGARSANHLPIKVSEIPQVKWKCPPKFGLNPTWFVVAGDESKEMEVENQREIRVLEAVYPRTSAIPPNPSVSHDTEGSYYNDQQTPVIPITPVEDEDATADTPSNFVAPFNIPISSQSPPLAPGVSPLQFSMPSIASAPINEKPAAGTILNVEPDVAAAASAAIAAITKSNEHGSLIDHDLLVKILGNPNMIEKLLTDYGTASSAQNIPKPITSPVPLLNPLPRPVTLPDPSSLHMNRLEAGIPSLVATSSGRFYPPSNGAGVGHISNARVPFPGLVSASSSPSVGVSQAKDVNYYKNLIQQHGEERKETSQQFGNRYSHPLCGNQESINNPTSRDLKPKIMKPCIYFNSSRGCRHGANCAYQHDASSQQRRGSIPEVQNAKRMKMDREISS
ncbi:hypothetical protein CFOL_v3_11358 [Cephalotus follicularis]|uniref:C3H1-type domain-containing protein n=1 Tax=Cephalotus follicularis TaxID=3775 RepID=A0A1Q3BJ15_CEPFO|nr:hypothetical protein CFOL_v3_11358 [Cephalotus follicularis]